MVISCKKFQTKNPAEQVSKVSLEIQNRKTEKKEKEKESKQKKGKRLTWTVAHQIGPATGPTPNTISFLRNRGGGHRLPLLLCSLHDTPTTRDTSRPPSTADTEGS
jgi:hypothetical protein